MTDALSPEAEAEALFEMGDYDAAVLKYRAAALHARPTVPLLWNLSTAVEVAHVAYLRQLLERYPDSVPAHLQLAKALMSGGRPASVVDVCTNLISRGDLTLADELKVRWTRLDAVTESNLPDSSYANNIFVEDFTRLWNVGNEAKWAVRSRIALLRIVARVSQPFLITAIEALVTLVSPLPSAETLLATKVNELVNLAEATAAMEQTS